MTYPTITPHSPAAPRHIERRATSGRKAVEREFVRLVQSAIERGDMTIERATNFMLEHGIGAHVVSAVIARAQQQTYHVRQS